MTKSSGLLTKFNVVTGVHQWTINHGINDGIMRVGSTYIYLKSNSNVMARSKTTGAQIWNNTTLGSLRVWSFSVGQDDTIFVSNSVPNTIALNGTTGVEKWRNTTAGLDFQSCGAVNTNRDIYVNTNDSTLYILRATTGVLLAQHTQTTLDLPFSLTTNVEQTNFLMTKNGIIHSNFIRSL